MSQVISENPDTGLAGNRSLADKHGDQQPQSPITTRQQLFKQTFVTPQTAQASFSSLGFGTGSYKALTYPTAIAASTPKPTNIRTTKVMLPPESLFLFGSNNQRTTTTGPNSTAAMPNMMESGVPCAGSGAALGGLQPLILFVTVTVTVTTFRMGNAIF
ncbi:GL24986 [Drosophila persimilis]|uniref:GL24986 n=1 Tax=Drosophila persimilis TaxID=7234 RepID=B4GRA5_DROPE|nr:GL24986 [Drosophila persimilis]